MAHKQIILSKKKVKSVSQSVLFLRYLRLLCGKEKISVIKHKFRQIEMLEFSTSGFYDI